MCGAWAQDRWGKDPNGSWVLFRVQLSGHSHLSLVPMVTNGLTRRDTWPERAGAALLAVVLLVGAGWFGATWVDPAGSDDTCGGLYRTDLWLNGPDVCTGVMLRRLGVVVLLVVIAGGFVYLAARRPRPRP